MPVVLCYGDSNTHGTRPTTRFEGAGRYLPGDRWPDAMATALGPGWTVLNEGLPGRTTVIDDLADEVWKNGLRVLPAVLHSHAPIDLVILMLGTNDLKARHRRSAFDVADGVRRLVIECRAHPVGPAGAAPQILVVCPTPIREVGPYAEMYAGAEDISHDLPRAFARMGGQMGVAVFDAGAVVAVDPADGIHFPAEAQRALGAALAERVRGMLE